MVNHSSCGPVSWKEGALNSGYGTSKWDLCLGKIKLHNNKRLLVVKSLFFLILQENKFMSIKNVIVFFRQNQFLLPTAKAMCFNLT